MGKPKNKIDLNIAPRRDAAGPPGGGKQQYGCSESSWIPYHDEYVIEGDRKHATKRLPAQI